MTVDENSFFRGATLRICGTLELAAAMQQCLLFIRQYLPASMLCFHLYERELGIVETVARAGLKSARTMKLRTALSGRGRRQVERQRSQRILLVERMGDDAVAGPVIRQMGDVDPDRAGLLMDLVLDRQFIGTVSVFSEAGKLFNGEHVALMALLNEPFAVALSNSLRYRELTQLRDMLADDNRYLQDELRRMTGEEVVGGEFGLRGVMHLVRQVAPLDSPVLLLGETGTGKEVIAGALHNMSPRREGPLIRVNCGAIAPTLLDSELFGHEKGAFTGALARKRGRFERAHGGTIFLDEIGELSPEAQVRLLRVLQEREIERIGGTGAIRLDIRVIAATHRDLEDLLAQGRFREDLYFRLRVFPIAIPPLRNRTADIPALVHHFILKKAKDMKLSRIPPLAEGELDSLIAYPWPGNVRELENSVERALILSRNRPLTFRHLVRRPEKRRDPAPGAAAGGDSDVLDLDQVVAEHVRKVLARCQGRIEGPRGAARLLNIHPSTLRKRMRKLNIPFGRGVPTGR